MLAYRLAPQVHVCATEDGATFLDVENDSYMGLDSEQACALSLVVEGWPLESEHGQTPRPLTSGERLRVDKSAALELARVLCERGLLVPATEPSSQELTGVPRQPSQPELELIPWCEMDSAQVSLRNAFRFLHSVLMVAMMLRFRSLSAIVARARRRRDLHTGDRLASFDLEAARNLVSAYSHMRPFLYGQKGRCLLDSLALLEFLARGGLYPMWVVGVRVHPFGSHSWLQYQSFILNGTPAYARAYTPILVV
jgi:hypothetical protein